MKNVGRIKLQFKSWIVKNRWEPLLAWFNQNDTNPDHWKLLLEQACLYDLQKKWPAYLDFFEKHLNYKTTRGPLETQEGMQERAWKLLNVAMPEFFLQVGEQLSCNQKNWLKTQTLKWFTPWLPKIDDANPVNERNAKIMGTVFRTLVNLDARDEWKIVEHLVNEYYIPRMIRCTLGKDIAWSNELKALHLNQGNTLDSWRIALFKNDCIEHLLAEKSDLPVVTAFLACVLQEPFTKTHRADDVLAMLFKRHPHFRVWSQHASGDDAQICRALLDLPEINAPVCNKAQTIGIGKSLGLPLVELVALLQKPNPVIDMPVSMEVFENIAI